MKDSKAIVFGVIFVLIAAAGVAYYFYKPQNKKNNQIACTQEALMCPNGAYVGRQGGNCAFVSCSNIGPFEGKLVRVGGGGFQLITQSPDPKIQEVAYALPLEIQNSNDLAGFVGQKVRVFGVFGEGNSFKVSRFESAGDVTLGEVGVGKSVFINGVLVTLNAITQDSRCPVDVQCIQAGSVTANVTLKSDTDKETIPMNSAAAPIGFDSFFISIGKVMPQKMASQAIDAQSYIFTFKVASR